MCVVLPNFKSVFLPIYCNCREQLLKSCWEFDSTLRPSVDYLIDVLEQSTDLVVPCLDAPGTSVALEGPGSLNMNLMPRIRHRNQYQKTPGGERVIRRGLSLSSHDDGKLSGELSPGAGTLPRDPFGLLLRAQPKRTCSKDNSFGDDAPENIVGIANRKPVGKLSFDSALRFSALSRSMSADERLGTCHRGVKGRGVTGVGALSSVRDADAASPFADGEERFATEPRRATIQRENEMPASLESRADSDYCSQHSKDFPNLGCAPFV